MQEPPDQAPATVELSPQSLDLLRAAVAGLDRAGVDGSELHDAVCAVAREARRRQLAPERLLVVFKSVWLAAQSRGASPNHRRQARIFEEMVSLCIREYFGNR